MGKSPLPHGTAVLTAQGCPSRFSSCTKCGTRMWATTARSQAKSGRPVRCRRCNGYNSRKGVSRAGYAYANGGLVHRQIMSQHLGRPLLKVESVHHLNGVRTDNRLENLELRCGPHGRGQNIEDLIDYVIQFHWPTVAKRRREWDQQTALSRKPRVESGPGSDREAPQCVRYLFGMSSIRPALL